MNEKKNSLAEIDDEDERIEELQQLIWRLPIEHVEMLRILTKHFQNVALKCQDNKMDVYNLAVVLGPSIMRVSTPRFSSPDVSLKFSSFLVTPRRRHERPA